MPGPLTAARVVFPRAETDADWPARTLAFTNNKKTDDQVSKDLVSFDSISPSSVVPLTELKHWPRAVACPACRESTITRVERKVSGGTHAMAGLFFICTVIGAPWPYFSPAFKNTEHYCCRCNRRLATFHFQSGIELHVF